MKIPLSDNVIKALPVLSGGDWRLGYYTKGVPIIPLQSHEDLKILASMGSLLRTHYYEPQAMDLMMKDIDPMGEVVCLAPEYIQEARLFAYLTQRSVRLGIASQLSPSPGLVVVMRSSQLTSSVLNALYKTTESTSAPGLLVSSNRLDLRTQILRRALARLSPLFSGPREIRIICGSRGIRGSKTQVTLGSQSPKSARIAALGAGAGLLQIISHSDGVDAYLGEGLTLCSRFDYLDGRASRPPRCVLTNTCHRAMLSRTAVKSGNFPKVEQLMSMQDAIKSGELLSPSHLSATTLVWDVCWGVVDRDFPIHQRWSLGLQLATHAAVGAMVTTWQLEIQNEELIERFSQLVAQGLRLGDVIATINSSPDARRFGNLFCLFGDPFLRLQLENNCLTSPEMKKCENSTMVNLSHEIPHSTRQKLLVEACLDRVQDECFPALGQLTALAVEGIKKISSDVSFNNFSNNSCFLEEYTSVQVKILNVFSRYEGSLFELYQSFGITKSKTKAPRCPHCRKVLNCLDVNLPGFKVDRIVSMCPRCGMIEDRESNSPIRLEIGKGGVLILKNLSLLDVPCSGLVVLDPVVQSERKTIPWPKDKSGRNCETLRLNKNLPIADFSVVVLLMVNLELNVYSVATRAEQLYQH
jgi:hypothetical protein